MASCSDLVVVEVAFYCIVNFIGTYCVIVVAELAFCLPSILWYM